MPSLANWFWESTKTLILHTFLKFAGISGSFSILEVSGSGSTIHANKPKKWSENLNPQKKYMVDVSGVFFFGVSDWLANRFFLPESSRQYVWKLRFFFCFGSQVQAKRLKAGSFRFRRPLHRYLSIFLVSFPKREIFIFQPLSFRCFSCCKVAGQHSQGWNGKCSRRRAPLPPPPAPSPCEANQRAASSCGAKENLSWEVTGGIHLEQGMGDLGMYIYI